MAGDRVNDKVLGVGFSYDCRIGFHEYERHIRQRILIDFDAEMDWRASAKADRAAGIMDYYEAHKAIGAMLEGREYRLIEAMAEDVARLLCNNFSIARVRVKVTKIPFDMPNAHSVGVECWRTPADFVE